MDVIWNKKTPSGRICLLLTAVVILVLSFMKLRLFGLDTSRTFCLLVMIWYLICLAVSRRVLSMMWMAAAIVVYLIYCYIPGTLIEHKSRQNCMVAGAILCIAVLAPRERKQNMKSEN